MVRSDSSLPQNAPADNAKQLQLPSSQVLASFQIQRTGQQVRIVEADGSAYEGRVVEPEQLASLQMASEENWQALKDISVPPGAANSAPQNSFGNFAGMRSNGGYVDNQANTGELPPDRANYDNILQNQATSPGADNLNLARLQQAVPGSGFAFRVSGLNRRLNQNVTIVGNCVNVPLPMNGSFSNGIPSNQIQTQYSANLDLQQNALAARAQPPASQSQNILQNNNLNYSNFQNTQNAALPGQFWRVTGQVQIGPTNHFDLDAATAAP